MPPQRSGKEEKRANPPRPPNHWILYRQDKWKEYKEQNIKGSQSEMSKRIATAWANEPPHIKSAYETRAAQAKADHHIRYPHYVYKPQQKKGKKDEDSEDSHTATGNRVSSYGTTSLNPIQITPYPTSGIETRDVISYYGQAGPSPPLSMAGSPDNIFYAARTYSSHSATSEMSQAAAISHQISRVSSHSRPIATPASHRHEHQPPTPTETLGPWDSPAHHQPYPPEQSQTYAPDQGIPSSITIQLNSSWIPPEEELGIDPSTLSDDLIGTSTLSGDLIGTSTLSGDFDFTTFMSQLLDHPGTFQVADTGEAFENHHELEIRLDDPQLDQMATWSGAPSPSEPIASTSSLAMTPHTNASMSAWDHASPFADYHPYDAGEGRENQTLFPDDVDTQSPDDVQPFGFLGAADAGHHDPYYSQTASSSSSRSSSRVTSVAPASSDRSSTSSPYQPPPGAMQSTTRRVGGAWKKPTSQSQPPTLQRLHAAAS